MKNKYLHFMGLLASILLIIFILDSKTAFEGATEGVKLCIQSILPALFPFFVISHLLISVLNGSNIRFLRPILRPCKIPIGAESVFLLGCVGGYPVGAQILYTSYQQGYLSKSDAQRMLGFCNNAGPSFIFGVTAMLFQRPVIAWVLWFLQIISAYITAVILPENKSISESQQNKSSVSLTGSLAASIRNIATVCGWIILFRTLIAFMKRWFLWLVPNEIAVFIIGITELSNGCMESYSIPNDCIRFILLANMLCIGGLCVFIQVCSVSCNLGNKQYISGKLIQTGVMIPLSLLCASILFPGNGLFIAGILSCTVSFVVTALWKMIYKNNTGNYETNRI